MGKRFKLNPKNFNKKRSQSKTYKDWNTETDHYSSPSRKKTILDEDPQSQKLTLNKNLRLNNSTISVGDGIDLLCDSSTRTKATLLSLLDYIPTSNFIITLFTLDRLGIYGENIYLLYSQVDSPEEFYPFLNSILKEDIPLPDSITQSL